MSNLTTNLSQWGSTGSDYPDGYNYLEGEQPVDAWDNYLTYHTIEEIHALQEVVNDRLESDSVTSFPASPEPGQIVVRTDSPGGSDGYELYFYDDAATTWRRLFEAGGDTMEGPLDLGGYKIEDSTGSLTLDGVIDAPDGSFNIGGNQALTKGDEGSGNGLDADTVDGDEAADLQLDIEEDGSLLVSKATGIDFTGRLKVSDDGDGTVTVEVDDRTNISDDGSTVVTDTDDINFGNKLNASDDGDGTATVDLEDDRTDISDDGSTVVTNTDDINFGSKLDASSDGDGSVTVNEGWSWNREQGVRASIGQEGSTTETINFNQTYDYDIAMYQISTDETATATGCQFDSWITDGNGNITGMDIIVSSDSGGGNVQLSWAIFGETL